MRGERITACRIEVASPYLVKPLSSLSPSQRAGIAYERRVTKLLSRFSGFLPQVVFRYNLKYESKSKLAILDGLLLTNTSLFVVEIKNQNNEVALIQLDRYMQLVEWWSHLPVWGLLICLGDRKHLSPIDRVSVYELGLRALKRLEREAKYGDGISVEAVIPFVRASRSARYNFDRHVHLSCLGCEGRESLAQSNA